MTNINYVHIAGEIAEEVTFSHEFSGEGFYRTRVAVERTSGVKDLVPIIVSERLINISDLLVGSYVYVDGDFRSYNVYDGVKRKLDVYLFVKDIEISTVLCVGVESNIAELHGRICRKSEMRTTPQGREITDFMLVTSRPLYRASAYIPCICWGRNARYVNNLEIGTNVSIAGRVQSREYQKKLSEDEIETRTAYEVSVNQIIKIEEGAERHEN